MDAASGFIRENCPHTVPTDIKRITSKYYETLQMQCSMNGARIMISRAVIEAAARQRGRDHVIPCGEMVVGDATVIPVHLILARRCEVGHGEAIRFRVVPQLPSDVEFIGGQFGLNLGGPISSIPEWKRVDHDLLRFGDIGRDVFALSRLNTSVFQTLQVSVFWKVCKCSLILSLNHCCCFRFIACLFS